MLYQHLKTMMKSFPKKTLSDENKSITYDELIRFAEMFSLRLTVPKIGILCRSELNVAKAVLACFAAGITVVPLSYQYGQAHIDRIISLTQISHLITDESGVIEIKQIAFEAPETEDISDAVFILCTSGTTGVPKGAILTNDNIIANLKGIGAYFDINGNDKILIARPLYHCAVMMGEFLTALCKGLDIVFTNKGFNPVQTIDMIRSRQITVLCGTPTLFYHLCRTSKRQENSLSLRVIALSGECMTNTVAKMINEVLPNTVVYNVYGLTEAGPRVSYLPPDLFMQYPNSVGISIDGATVKVQNGELHVCGDSVMKGYYGDINETKRVLADGWLHTGDLAKISNGLISILGRKDDMIIRAGINIYPQEIENALKEDPRITDVLAYGTHKNTTQEIHLYAVAENMNLLELMKTCRERLPPYQIPDGIRIVNELPRNASGKLIRKPESYNETYDNTGEG